MSPQQSAIIAHINIHGSITGREAVLELNMLDLRKRISELRRLGYVITDIWEDHEDGKHKRYFLGGRSNA